MDGGVNPVRRALQNNEVLSFSATLGKMPLRRHNIFILFPFETENLNVKGGGRGRPILSVYTIITVV